MRARIPSAEAFRSRRRMTRRWSCLMLSLREITRNPNWSHFSRIGVRSVEGSLHLFVPIRIGGGSARACEADVESMATDRVGESDFEIRSAVMPAELRISDEGGKPYGSPVVRFRMPPMRWCRPCQEMGAAAAMDLCGCSPALMPRPIGIMCLRESSRWL